MEYYKTHYIAIIGGSISGSEAANLLAKSGFKVVVFDMNALPYGKIEDGLPKWHISLRNRQEQDIDKKLDQQEIRFVPLVKIGRDIILRDLVENWGFSAVILANGAWKDRTLNINGIDKYLNKNVIYQNEFIYWFNHKHEPNFKGEHIKIKDNSVVIGGGLASLDVVKIVMIELVKEKLELLFNIKTDVFTLEKYGIDKLLSEYKLTFKDLNLNGVTLIYRREAKDMPLKDPKDNTKAQIEKAQLISEKLLLKYKEKFKFNFKPLSIPIAIKEAKGELKGILIQSVKKENGKLVPIKEQTELIKTDMIVSSIGSIPEKIEGLSYKWDALLMKRKNEYSVEGFENVFAIGNAVTGRGNIQDSKQHGKKMTRKIIDLHLTDDEFEKWLIRLNESIKDKVAVQVDKIISSIKDRAIQPKDIIQQILDKTQELNDLHHYTTYKSWIKKHRPPRLEDIIKKQEA